MSTEKKRIFSYQRPIYLKRHHETKPVTYVIYWNLIGR
jgi:hypothetical protein